MSVPHWDQVCALLEREDEPETADELERLKAEYCERENIEPAFYDVLMRTQRRQRLMLREIYGL